MPTPSYEGQQFEEAQFENMGHVEQLEADEVNDYPAQSRFMRLWWNLVRAANNTAAKSLLAIQAATTATTKASEAAASAVAAATFDPALYVAKAGGTMTGPLNVPAGATGNQAPRLSEVVKKTGDTMSGALEVPAGATGNQVPRVSEVLQKSGDTLTGYIVGILGAVGLQLPTMDDVVAYVSEVVGSKRWKDSVKAATTAALPACTYSNGNAGVGATLTGSANGALAAQDGVILGLNEDLAVKNQSNGAQNGIYRLTQVGGAGAPFVLTRRTDANTSAKLVSATVLVEQGTENGETQWTCSNDSITVGTTALTFVLTGGKKSVTTDGAQTLINKIIDAALNTISNVANSCLAAMPANTIKLNATNANAAPTDFAIAASRLLGRGNTGDIAAIVPDANQFSFNGATLNSKAYEFNVYSGAGALTVVELFNSIPSWATEITITAALISTNGTSNIIFQVGDADGYETGGYNGSMESVVGSSPTCAAYPGTGFQFNSALAANVLSGQIKLTRYNTTGWMMSGALSNAGTGVYRTFGYKFTDKVTDRLRMTTVNGLDTFDAGGGLQIAIR